MCVRVNAFNDATYHPTKTHTTAPKNSQKSSGPAREDANIAEKLQEAKLALKKSKRVCLYALLGCGPSSSEVEIKKAYKKAALKWHPDRHRCVCCRGDGLVYLAFFFFLFLLIFSQLSTNSSISTPIHPPITTLI